MFLFKNKNSDFVVRSTFSLFSCIGDTPDCVLKILPILGFFCFLNWSDKVLICQQLKRKRYEIAKKFRKSWLWWVPRDRHLRCIRQKLSSISWKPFPIQKSMKRILCIPNNTDTLQKTIPILCILNNTNTLHTYLTIPILYITNNTDIFHTQQCQYFSYKTLLIYCITTTTNTLNTKQYRYFAFQTLQIHWIPNTTNTLHTKWYWYFVYQTVLIQAWRCRQLVFYCEHQKML
jgi:hypothetical protein